MDMAVLVVAADDGVMPQTLDHLEVLKFLRARTGLVVLTKTDLVDRETVELAELEIRDLLAGSFLEGKPVIPFSAVDGRGAQEVLAAIEAAADEVREKSGDSSFRLWIDQVRSFSGFGTVVSGTVLSGSLSKEDPVWILPSGKETRARFLEVHHERVERALTGQRVGVNLHRIPMEEVHIGMALASPGALRAGYLFNARLTLLPRARKPITGRPQVRLFAGTCSVRAVVVLTEGERLNPGESGLVQLRLLSPVALMSGDPFVVSPMDRHTVIGGGVILEATREKYRSAKAAQVLSYLQALEQGNVREVVQRVLARNLFHPVTIEDLSRETALRPEKIRAEIVEGLSRGEIFEIEGKGFVARERLDALKQRTETVVKDFYAQNPLATSVKTLELKGRLPPSLDEVLLQRILHELCTEGRITESGSGYRLPDFRVKLLPEQEKLAALLLRYARESGLVPFGAGKFCRFNMRLRTFSQPEIQKILDHWRNEGRLIKLKDGRYLSPAALEEVKARVRAVISERGVFLLEDLKEALGCGRTRGIPVLEHLDEIGFTVRFEQGRVLRSLEPESGESPERLPRPQKATEQELPDRP